MTARRVRLKIARRRQVARWVHVPEADVPHRLERLLQRARVHREGTVIVGADGAPRALLVPAAAWAWLVATEAAWPVRVAPPAASPLPTTPSDHDAGDWIGTPTEL